MKKEYIYIVLIIGVLGLISTVFRPVYIPDSEEKCLKSEGMVEGITEGGTKDIVFRLKDDPTQYYINRGLEQGLNLDSLRERLLDQSVTIFYPEHKTLLNLYSTSKHLSVLKHNGETFFTEID